MKLFGLVGVVEDFDSVFLEMPGASNLEETDAMLSQQGKDVGFAERPRVFPLISDLGYENSCGAEWKVTASRLTHLYRQAQAIPHFSIVYEQRRTTSTLVAGFRSLGSGCRTTWAPNRR